MNKIFTETKQMENRLKEMQKNKFLGHDLYDLPKAKEKFGNLDGLEILTGMEKYKSGNTLPSYGTSNFYQFIAIKN